MLIDCTPDMIEDEPTVPVPYVPMAEELGMVPPGRVAKIKRTAAVARARRESTGAAWADRLLNELDDLQTVRPRDYRSEGTEDYRTVVS